MPPPIRSRSVSTSTTWGFWQNEKVQVSFSMLSIPPWSARRLLAGLVVEEPGTLELRVVGLRLAGVQVDGPFDRRPDRELEALEHAVAELPRPHDGVGRTHRDDVRAERREVL